MELEKFERQLRLLLLLTQNTQWSIEQISQQAGMNRRSVYRYLEAYKRMGFIIEKRGTKYRIGKDSPFFSEISDLVRFTEDEALTIHQILSTMQIDTPQLRNLREKLSHLYDLDVLIHYGIDKKIAQNISNLYQAIKLERVCVLHNYSSPSSQKVSSRIIEPYRFIDQNQTINAYEIQSGKNKAFKVSRAESVEILDLSWSYKDKHLPHFTDLFHFNGEPNQTVQLLLGQLATNVLLEEYPLALQQLKPQPDGRHLLTTEVCSFKGVGRFVLGLYQDIEIVGNEDFMRYIEQQLQHFTQKCQRNIDHLAKTDKIESLT